MSPRRQLSVLRILVAIVIAAVTAASGYAAVRRVLAPPPAAPLPAWFAPYVDATLPPPLQFQNRGTNPKQDVVLGFVVSNPNAGCTPSWGAHYSLANASTMLDLDRRIVRLRQLGGDAIVSFGGQSNVELASACQDVSALAAAYGSVITRYHLTTIDFDLEGSTLGDAGANRRRARAIKQIQGRIRSQGGRLAIWLTLPSTPSGLATEGVSAIDAMLAAHVDLAGINVLTMDFGVLPDSTQLIAAVEESLAGTQRQVLSAYTRAGIHLTGEHAWNKLGATPMIGQNDVSAEVFNTVAAQELVAFVNRHHLRRVSMWSLNRDVACGENGPPKGTVSNHCSGVPQATLAFSRTFAQLPGRPAASAGAITIPDKVGTDDPATSPYPIWSSTQGYMQGYKVVWHHNVFKAKWWNQGQLPDAPIVHDWETPWVLVGPVLPNEHPAKPVALVSGAFPTWSPTTVYQKGDRVSLGGLPYEAKWWTQGNAPSKSSTAPGTTAWRPLFTIGGEPIPG